MATDKEIKKNIAEDWQNAFPQLTLYAQNKLYKVIGAIIIGLELIKLPRTEGYRPHFVVYPLWKKDVKECLEFPFILKEYYSKKRLQYSIPYAKHNIFFNDAIESVKEQTMLPFDHAISLKEIISIVDGYSKTAPLSASPNSYLQALLQEAKFKMALFIGEKEAYGILEQINKRSWDANHFKAFGVDVSEWFQSLQATISNRDKFMAQIERNKQDKKISKLKSSRLIA